MKLPAPGEAVGERHELERGVGRMPGAARPRVLSEVPSGAHRLHEGAYHPVEVGTRADPTKDPSTVTGELAQ
jgi:hypothetical protein